MNEKVSSAYLEVHLFRKCIDEILKRFPGVKIYLCTDANQSIKKIIREEYVQQGVKYYVIFFGMF